MRMKAPPRRKFLLRLSKQLGDTAWQKSVPPLSQWGGSLDEDGVVLVCVCVCVAIACFCVGRRGPASMSNLRTARTVSTYALCSPSLVCVSLCTLVPSLQWRSQNLKVASRPQASLKKLLVPCLDVLLSCVPSLRSSLYNVLYDLGENDPVADCYMVGAQ